MRRVRDKSDFDVLFLEAPAGSCPGCAQVPAIVANRRRPLQTLSSKRTVVFKDRACQQQNCGQRDVIIRPLIEGELPTVRSCEYGLDVIGHIGESRLSLGKSMPEIHRSLVDDHGVRISERHVGNLFRVFMALVHCVNADLGVVREKLQRQGRLVLAIDGVYFDDVSPALFVVRDVLSREILYSERVIQKDGDTLAELLEKVKALGIPIVGVISDKETGLVSAVEKALPNVPHQLCQTHFLKNIAKQMDGDLAQLNGITTKALTQIKELERNLDTHVRKFQVSAAEANVARQLCTAARTGAKVSGDPILNPAALRRFERMDAVLDAVKKATKKPGGKWLLLKMLGTALSGICDELALAKRLRNQVEMVRTIARILNLQENGEEVRKKLGAYLNRLLRGAGDPGPDDPRSSFICHMDGVAGRYWKGLFFCYDNVEIPKNDNELEQMFSILKRHERKITGRKSTVGGPLETAAEFVLEAWSAMQLTPDLLRLMEQVSDEQLCRARNELERIAGPARERRSIQRDPESHLDEVLEDWLNP